MNRAWSFLSGAGGAFVLAVVIFGLAVIGHVALPLALVMAGAWVTVSVTEVECVAEGAVPVTVSVWVPVAVVPVFTVRVELPPAVTDVGLNVAVAPLGTPETVRLIVSALPETSAVEMVLIPCVPCTRVKLEGVAEIEKSLGGGPPQPENLNVPTRIFQLKVPLLGRYSLVTQNVQSSLGSTPMKL